MLQRRMMMANANRQLDNPLDAAVRQRDRSAVQMATEAVKHNQCFLAFQPVMQAQPPHQCAFYEGFIRVLDETGRVIPARDFMPSVENTEIGRELDCNALKIGLQTLARNPTIRLSINMSARSIGFKKWSQILNRHLKKDASLGERLILEINETSVMTVPELVIDFMDQLQEHGIAFALDDFGAGNIALRLFREFFFDAAKIDGQFIRGIDKNPDNQAVVRSLITIAKQFDMFTIAESVETVEEAEFLVSQGVDCLQGFLFGAPTVNPPWKQSAQDKRRA